MRKKVKKRLLSLLLCGTMVFSLCPPAAAAVEKDRQNNAGVPNMGRNESKNKAENKASSSNALEQEKMEIASSSNAVQMKNSAMLATMQLNQSEFSSAHLRHYIPGKVQFVHEKVFHFL